MCVYLLACLCVRRKNREKSIRIMHKEEVRTFHYKPEPAFSVSLYGMRFTRFTSHFA